MAYPVSVTTEPALTNRDRVTTLFRLILAIPHLILVGGMGAASSRDTHTTFGSQGGLLGAAAAVMSIVSWFSILFTGVQIGGIRQFTAFYLRWRVNALAYVSLLEDQYPPFGDGPYPASIEIAEPKVPRDRVSVAFRLLLALPHIFVLAFVILAWCVTTVIAWFSILIGGNYPEGLYRFGVGVLRWTIRVETYLLLMVDEYPPFSLEP